MASKQAGSSSGEGGSIWGFAMFYKKSFSLKSVFAILRDDFCSYRVAYEMYSFRLFFVYMLCFECTV